MYDKWEYEDVKKIEIIQHRWYVHIIITPKEGEPIELYGSADAYYTEQSHLWFGTKEEYEAYDEGW